MKRFYLILLLLCFLVINLFADETRTSINVPEDFNTIQDAIEQAVTGDLIIVSPGTYYENINFLGKEIVVGSMYYTTQDTSYISQTIIDGGQNGSVVTFNSNESNVCVLSGFTITNGTGNEGGGIYCDDYTCPTLDNLKIINNQATSGGGLYFGQNSSINITSSLIQNNNSTCYGGGAYLYYCDLIMEDVVIDNNGSGNEGGGLSCWSSDLTMNNIELTNNSTTGSYGYGGGIHNYWESNISMDSCLIEGNSAWDGGGIYHHEMGNMCLDNSIIRNNEATDSGGGISFCYGTDLSIQNSEIVNNISGDKGGGVYVSGNNIVFTNVLIAGNSSVTNGGGIFLNGWTGIDIINSTIAGNSTDGQGGGIYSYYSEDDIKLINSLVWSNSPQAVFLNGQWEAHELTVAYSNIEGDLESIGSTNFDNVIINWMDGNIDSYPMFIDESAGNYHLASDSPCIDAAAAYFEYDEDILVDLDEEDYFGEAPDMGAFEFNGIRYGDINNDNSVDSFDASLLLMYSIGMDPLEEDPTPWEDWRLERADVNLDGDIEALDAAYTLQTAVGLIELPVMGGIRGTNDLTLHNDEEFIYLNSGTELISFEYTICESNNLKFGAAKVISDDCLYQQINQKMAIISASGIKGDLVQIPYTEIDDHSESFVTLDLVSNGNRQHVTYLLNGDSPAVSRIRAVYPNPFNPETTIDYQLAQPGKTIIDVFNIKGQKVSTLFDGVQKAGDHSFQWNADQQNSGVYFIRINSGSFEDTRKVILLK